MRRVAMVAVCLALAGCQTETASPSGSPEVTLRGVKPAQVKPQIVNAALNSGLKLRGDSDYQLTFERPWGGVVGSVAVGALLSTNAAPAVERLAFSIADTGTGTRVVLDRYMVKVGSFGREDVNPANNGLGLEPLQTTLDKVTAGIR